MSTSNHELPVGVTQAEAAREANLKSRITQVIKSHAEDIERIIERGEVAIVAHEADERWCGALGIAPGTPVHVAPMPGPMRRRMIEGGDSITARWLRGGRTGRVFFVSGHGSLLLNYRDGELSTEPGSLDAEAS